MTKAKSQTNPVSNDGKVQQLSLLDEENNFPHEKVENGINPLNLVTQSNSLIEMPQDLTLQEKRIILTLASFIHPNDEDFKKHYIRVKDLAEIIGIEDKNFYNKVKKTITGLQSKQLRIVRNEGNQQTEEYVNWLGYSKYFNGHGTVGLSFWPDMKDYLLEIKREFTQIRLRYLLSLKSEYSIRIYEILKRYEGLKKQYFSLEKLRLLLNIEPEKYAKYGHFKSRILLPAQRDLAEKTDIHFKLEEKKVGRVVVGVTFHITTEDKKVREVIEQDEISKGNGVAVLIDMGVHFEVAKKLVKDFGEERVLNNLEYVVATKSDEKIDNIAGYVVAAIKKNYVESDSPPATIIVEEEGYPISTEYSDSDSNIAKLNKEIASHIEFTEMKLAFPSIAKNPDSVLKAQKTGIKNALNVYMESAKENNWRELAINDLKHSAAIEIFEQLKKEPR